MLKRHAIAGLLLAVCVTCVGCVTKGEFGELEQKVVGLAATTTELGTKLDKQESKQAEIWKLVGSQYDVILQNLEAQYRSVEATHKSTGAQMEHIKAMIGKLRQAKADQGAPAKPAAATATPAPAPVGTPAASTPAK